MSNAPVTQTEKLAMFLAWGQKCVWCGTPLTFRQMEVEHLLPKSLKGNALAEALSMHGLAEDFDLDAKPNLAPSCHTCNNDKNARIPPNVPGIALLLQKAAKLQPQIEKNAASFAAQKDFDYALGIIEATAEAAELDAEAQARLRAAAEVLAPLLTKTGAAAPEEEVALHPAMSLILGDWKLVTALSDRVAIVTDGKGAGTIGTDISFMCSRCGSYGPWNGIICLICGNREAPD